MRIQTDKQLRIPDEQECIRPNLIFEIHKLLNRPQLPRIDHKFHVYNFCKLSVSKWEYLPLTFGFQIGAAQILKIIEDCWGYLVRGLIQLISCVVTSI